MDYDSLLRLLKVSEKQIRESVESDNIEQSIRWMIVRSNLLYEQSVYYFDGLIENCLNKVFHKPKHVCLSDTDSQVKTDRVVLFDAVSKDRRGLSNQYVDALIANGIEFLYISENTNLKRTEIFQHIEQYDKASWCIVPSSKKNTDKVLFIYNSIIEYAPTKVLCHILPWSIPALVALATLPKNFIKININITDHTFWSGVSIMDYNIEFRNYGKMVSIQKRGLSDVQEYVLPYYPYIDNVEFRGFEGVDARDKVIIFWGGALYKIYDEDDTFLKLIAKVLNTHPNCICLCAGGGDANHLLSFIKSEGLEHVWHYIGFRKDIYQVVCHSDIIVNTYPIGGGLMCQYAAFDSKPVISYAKTKAIEEVLSTSAKVTCLDEDDFLNRIDMFISDKSFRETFGKGLKDSLPTPSKFNAFFKKIVDKCTSSFSDSYIIGSSLPEVKEKRKDYLCESTLVKNIGLKSLFYYPRILLWVFKKNFFGGDQLRKLFKK